MKKYVVIGSSAAGVNGIRELRKYDKDAEIVLISKDKDIYSRCILHEYLAGKRSIERLRFVEKDFETLYRVNWKKGIEVTGLDRRDEHLKIIIVCPGIGRGAEIAGIVKKHILFGQVISPLTHELFHELALDTGLGLYVDKSHIEPVFLVAEQ